VGTKEDAMPLARVTLEQLTAPLKRGNFPAFVAAVEQLPSVERNVLAVLGAGALLSTLDDSQYLREESWRNLMESLAQFTKDNVEGV
jgi:hypothetical protein